MTSRPPLPPVCLRPSPCFATHPLHSFIFGTAASVSYCAASFDLATGGTASKYAFFLGLLALVAASTVMIIGGKVFWVRHLA